MSFPSETSDGILSQSGRGTTGEKLMIEVFASRADLPRGFALEKVSARPLETRVLMVDPEHFRLAYAINPHMVDTAGALHVVDSGAARRQWEALRKSYLALDFDVEVLSGRPEHPDMVFCANQSIAARGRDGQPRVVLSRMRAPERQGEVAHFAAWYEGASWPTERPGGEGEAFESAGDLLLWPGRRLAVGGFGPRSDRDIVVRAAAALEVDLALVELVDADFYHLDTALVPLDDRRALWFPGAFSGEGRELLEAMIPELLAVPESEARRAFATNAHCPDRRHVLIDDQAVETRKILGQEGFEVLPLATAEFRKSGGSVFCMKLMIP
jgi:arginine dihydrolase